MANNLVDGVDVSTLGPAVAVATSAGAADSGKLPKLDGSGKLSTTFLQELVDTDKQLTPTATELAPVATNSRLFAQSFGNTVYPSFIAPTEADGGVQYPVILQPALFSKRVYLMQGVYGYNTPTGIGWASGVSYGTATARNFSAGAAGSELARIGYVSVATANNLAGPYFPTGFRRGTQASGGFFFHARFAIAQINATVRGAFGMFGPVNGAADPSAWTGGMACFAMNSADTNMKFMHKPAGGTTTIVDLGSGLAPKTVGTTLELFVACRGGSSRLTYGWRRLDGAGYAYPRPAYTVAHVTTNLPAASDLMFAGSILGNGATASAVGIDIGHIYAEQEQ